MGNLLDRYPTIKRIQLSTQGAGSDALALIQPYLDWQIGEVEHEHALLLYKSPRDTSVDHLYEQIVILLGEAAAAWLKHQYAARSK